jgi:predicted dehydrogenase
MTKIRLAVVGTGSFGRNHVRVLKEMPDVDLVAIYDASIDRAASVAAEFHCGLFAHLDALAGQVDAAIVCTPTTTHADVAAQLLTSGIDVLIEKPIASSVEEGRHLADLADKHGRVLQVGHLERFNPGVEALESAATTPLFFEIHRLCEFSPRSLDVDVVLDLMIHDLDIVLALTKEEPAEIRAAGISVLSPKVDIANVRLAFASGCVANLTASRISTERVRKLRLFQPGEYLSLDYQRQDVSVFSVSVPGPAAAELPQIGFRSLPVTKAEPLLLELRGFVEAVRTRGKPRVDGRDATRTLQLAQAILGKIQEHAGVVTQTLAQTRS